MVNCCNTPLGRWAAGPPARAAAAAAQAATPVRLGCLFELLLIRLIFKIDGDHEHGDKLRVFSEQPNITDISPWSNRFTRLGGSAPLSGRRAAKPIQFDQSPVHSYSLIEKEDWSQRAEVHHLSGICGAEVDSAGLGCITSRVGSYLLRPPPPSLRERSESECTRAVGTAATTL